MNKEQKPITLDPILSHEGHDLEITTKTGGLDQTDIDQLFRELAEMGIEPGVREYSRAPSRQQPEWRYTYAHEYQVPYHFYQIWSSRHRMKLHTRLHQQQREQ